MILRIHSVLELSHICPLFSMLTPTLPPKPPPSLVWATPSTSEVIFLIQPFPFQIVPFIVAKATLINAFSLHVRRSSESLPGFLGSELITLPVSTLMDSPLFLYHLAIEIEDISQFLEEAMLSFIPGCRCMLLFLSGMIFLLLKLHLPSGPN